MPEGLKIQVGADVQQAVKALSQDVPKAADKAGDSFQKLGAIVEKSSVTFNRTLPQSFTKSKAAVLQLQAPLSKLGDTLETLRAKLGARQSFLNIEKDPAKVAALNREISLLNAEILRVGNIGRQGFDGLGNAISKVPPQLATVASGAGKTFSILRQAAFILPGIGIAGLIGGLTDLVAGLFETGNAFSQADVFAGQFNNRIKAIKESVESLKDALEFEGKIKKLGLELSGLSGDSLSIGKSAVDIAQSNKLLPELDNRIKQLTESNKNLVTGFLKTNEVLGKLGAGSQLVNLVRQFGAIENIPSSLGDKLNKTDKELLRQYQETNTEIKALRKQRTETVQGIAIDSLGILVDINKGIKSEQEKLSKPIKVPTLKIKPTKVEVLRPELGSIQIELPTVFDVLSEDARSRFAQQIDKLNEKIKTIGKPVILPFKLNLSPESINNNNIVAQLKKQQEIIAQTFGISTEESPLTRIQKEAVLAAQTINDVLQPAFKGLFDAIVAGESPLKAFFSGLGVAVQQLIQKLISAAVTAAILSAIFPAGVGGAKGFGAIFGKLLGFADGGLVTGPQLALIGEGQGTSKSNPEVVAPLDKLKGMLAGMGGGGMQRVIVTGRLRGNDMVLQNARTSRYQNRTTGR